MTYSEGAAEMQEGSFRVRAATPVRIYYLTPEDRDQVIGGFVGYAFVQTVLRSRSFAKNQQRAGLLHIPPTDRIIYVHLNFPTLLRAPIEDLSEFLGLETEAQKTALQDIRSVKFSEKGQLSEKHN